jgi:very-long-chain ceramide synthase
MASQTSKTLNYLDSAIVGPYFGLFIFVWIYLRHYLNLCILYATLTEFRTVGPFELDWAAGQFKCRLSQYITFGLLASLQAVNLFWLFLILRIAKNYVITAVVADERSDNEDEEEADTGKDGDDQDLDPTTPASIVGSERRRNPQEETITWNVNDELEPVVSPSSNPVLLGPAGSDHTESTRRRKQ